MISAHYPQGQKWFSNYMAPFGYQPMTQGNCRGFCYALLIHRLSNNLAEFKDVLDIIKEAFVAGLTPEALYNKTLTIHEKYNETLADLEFSIVEQWVEQSENKQTASLVIKLLKNDINLSQDEIESFNSNKEYYQGIVSKLKKYINGKKQEEYAQLPHKVKAFLKLAKIFRYFHEFQYESDQEKTNIKLEKLSLKNTTIYPLGSYIDIYNSEELQISLNQLVKKLVALINANADLIDCAPAIDMVLENGDHALHISIYLKEKYCVLTDPSNVIIPGEKIVSFAQLAQHVIDSFNNRESDLSSMKISLFASNCKPIIANKFRQLIQEKQNEIIATLTKELVIRVDGIGASLLTIACRSGNITLINACLSLGANPNVAFNANGLTPLIQAVSVKNIAVISTLLNNINTDPNLSLTSSNMNPLLIASQNGELDIVNLLLAHAKIDTSFKNKHGQGALFLAAQKNHLPIVQVLLAHSTMSECVKALYIASKNGYVSIVDFLIQHNISPFIPVLNGESAVSIAIREGKLDVLKTIFANYDINTPCDGERNVPLALAKKYNRHDIKDLLLNIEAKQQTAEKDGNQLLGEATQKMLKISLATNRSTQFSSQACQSTSTKSSPQTSLHRPS